MSIAYSPRDAILDTVAVALILAPEPASTAVGIALLARPRNKSSQKALAGSRVCRSPEYQYRVENIRGREITWEARTLMPGQLPLKKVNKPSVTPKPRVQYLSSSTPAVPKPTVQSALERLSPATKMRNGIYKPERLPETGGQNVLKQGTTIYHTLREKPRNDPAYNREQPYAHTHHTIENSPGYIKARASGIPVSGSNIIHHTIANSPAAQHGNPANIVKPVYIVEHHELNKTAPIRINGRLIQPPSPPANRRTNITGR